MQKSYSKQEEFHLEDVKETAKKSFKKHGKVVAVGVGKENGQQVIRVAMKEKPTGNVPKEIKGFPVRVIILGKTLKF